MEWMDRSSSLLYRPVYTEWDIDMAIKGKTHAPMILYIQNGIQNRHKRYKRLHIWFRIYRMRCWPGRKGKNACTYDSVYTECNVHLAVKAKAPAHMILYIQNKIQKWLKGINACESYSVYTEWVVDLAVNAKLHAPMILYIQTLISTWQQREKRLHTWFFI